MIKNQQLNKQNIKEKTKMKKQNIKTKTSNVNLLMNKKSINLKKLTNDELFQMNKTVVHSGERTFSNGINIKYHLTLLDVLRREVSIDNEIMNYLNNGNVNHSEIYTLLSEIYGEYPKNRLIDNYFTIINN